MRFRSRIFRVPALILTAWPLQADVGLPMLSLTWPGMLIALLPVVAIEAWIMKPRLQLPTAQALRFALHANIVSTVIGIPLAWLIMFCLELVATDLRGFPMNTFWGKFLSVTVEAPWLMPSESEFYWMIPAATLALFPAFFLASWGIEFLVIRRSFEEEIWNIFEPDPTRPTVNQVRRAVLQANVGSYTLLALLALIWLGTSLARGPQVERHGRAEPEPPIIAHVEVSEASSSIGRESVRIEFENSHRKHVTVRVSVGNGPCNANRVVATHELRGEAGFVVSPFIRPGEIICYSTMPKEIEKSSLDQWSAIRLSTKEVRKVEAYRVKLP